MHRIARRFPVVLIAALACLGPMRADTLAASAGAGYGRLLFTLTPADHVTARVVGQVLTIGFNRKVAITPDAVAQALPGYIASGRADTDGKTFRFALSQPARLHTSVSSDKFAVDLAPPSYAGTPPDLPPPPPPPPAKVDPATLETIKVRSGSYRDYTRLVFDWPRTVQYAAYGGAGRLTLRFATPAKLDFSALASQAPPWVKTAAWRIENRTTIVELATDLASGYHDFRDGTHVVVDVLAPKTDADAYNRPGQSKPAATALHPSSAVQDIAEAAAKLNHPVATVAPAKLAAAAPPPKPLKPEPPTPAALPPAASPPPADAAPSANPGVDSKLTRDGAALTFPAAGRRPAAVFVRGLTAWIVLVDCPPLDVNKLKAQLGTFPAAVDVASSSNITQLRIDLREAEEIAAFAEGSTLKVVIAPQVNSTAIAIGFARNQDSPTRSSISTLLPGAAVPVRLVDPVAGDEIVIVPGAAGRDMAAERNYVEFTALKTASGLALLSFVDDLSVSVNATRVTIARPGGLSLTAAAVPEGPARAGRNDPAFLDFVGWRKINRGTFLATERRLRAASARLDPKDANRARLALARFYLANGFSAEALGIIGLMQTSDPALQSDMRLQTMRAAADLAMGRHLDARNAVAAAQFDSDRHAALWRGLAETALENWTDARTYLERAMPVLGAYEPAMQARVHLALAESALGTSTLEVADAQLARLPAGLDRHLTLEAALDRARLLAAENRRGDAERLFARVEASDDEPLACAAIYYRVAAGLAAGRMKPALAVNALERLRYRWRGDLLELKTLRKLASIYFGEKRWRDGLQALRVAAANFPNDDQAGKAQDDMRTAFVDLFLKGKADAMPPVEALALFYDFIELTPIGPDGDEMIRRMADRLVAVDLLGPAADLLDYQISKRLDGVARAQVATRLAMVQLMDHKPQVALDTLRSTQISTLPDDVAHQRLLLEARALADQKQWDTALDLIAVDQSPDTVKLRADIHWRAANWPLAGQNAEELLANRWSDAAPLTAEDRQEVMRAAVAYSMANDQTSLDRLRQHFADKMKASPDAAAFAVITQRIDMHGLAFRDAAAQVASVDMLKSFMIDLQKRTD